MLKVVKKIKKIFNEFLNKIYLSTLLFLNNFFIFDKQKI